MANNPPMGGGNLPAPLRYAGQVIHDRGEMVSLTDMWRATGADPSREPAKWRRLPSVRQFVSHLAIVVLRKSEDGMFEVRRGTGAGTWAHWQLSIAYARYGSHEYHVWANTAVRERMEGAQASKRLPALSNPSDPATILSVFEYLRAEAAQGREASAALQRIEASEGSRCITDVAKLLDMGPKALRRELVARRWIYQRPGSDVWIAYQDKLNSIFLEHEPHHYSGRDGTPRVKMNVLITPKGMVHLARLLVRTLKSEE